MRLPAPFGKYLLLDKLPSSVLTEVFVARDRGVAGLQRLVSLKRLQPNAAVDEEVRNAFLDEARISLSLNHANILHVLEVGQEGDDYFLAMEYVAGQSLEALLQRLGEVPLDTTMAVYLATRICEGLDHAHRKRDGRGQPMEIVHRGVAPNNVLLTYEGEVKLVEFGLAKAANRLQRTQVGVRKGELGYMSPEQVRGEPVDRRADIFAVGLLLYRMVTGRAAFEATNELDLMERVARGAVVPPHEWNPDLSPRLDETIMRALSPQPGARHPWASDLNAELTRHLLAAQTPFTAQRLASCLRAEFGPEAAEEEKRLERWMDARAEAGPSRPAPASGRARPAPSPGSGFAGGFADEAEDDDEGPVAATQVVDAATLLKLPPGGPASPGVAAPRTGAAPEQARPPWEEVLPFEDEDEDDFTAPEVRAPVLTPPPEPEPALAPTTLAAPPRPRGRGPLWAIASALALLVVAGGALFLFGSRDPGEGAMVIIKVSPQAEGTRVTMSGRLIQPDTVVAFPAGDYDLRVTAPGYRPHAQQVVIFPHERQAALSVFLHPLDAPAPAPGPVAPVVAGSVTFEGPTGAEVLVDGASIGKVPAAKLEALQPGKRLRYEARKSGYEPLTGELVVAGGPQTVTLALEPRTVGRKKRSPPAVSAGGRHGYLVLTSDPEGAQVWIDGKPTSRRTPVTPADPLKLPVGRRKVLLDLGGMTSEVLVVEVKEGEFVTLQNVLLDQISEL